MGKKKTGCFGRLFGCLFSIVLTGLILGGVFFAVTTAWRSIGAYEHAMEKTRSSKKVTKLIGKPVEDGFMMLPSINVEGANGYAKLEIPVSGPKGKGVVHVDATKSGGNWTYKRLEFVSDGGKKINLRSKKDAAAAPPDANAIKKMVQEKLKAAKKKK